MATNYSVSTTLTARNLTGPAFADMTRRAEIAHATVARLGAGLGSLATAATVAGAALAALGVKMAAGQAEAAGKLVDASDATGVALAALERLKFDGGSIGIDFETITDAVTRLSRRFGELSETGSASNKKLAEISPALAQLVDDAQTPEEALAKLRDGLSGLSEEQRLAASGILFGNGAASDMARIFGLSAEEVAALDASWKTLGGSQEAQIRQLDQLGDKIDKLSQSADRAKVAFSAGLAPGLGQAAESLQRWLAANPGQIENWGKNLGEAFTNIDWDRVSAGLEAAGRVAGVLANALSLAASALVEIVKLTERLQGRDDIFTTPAAPTSNAPDAAPPKAPAPGLGRRLDGLLTPEQKKNRDWILARTWTSFEGRHDPYARGARHSGTGLGRIELPQRDDRSSFGRLGRDPATLDPVRVGQVIAAELRGALGISISVNSEGQVTTGTVKQSPLIGNVGVTGVGHARGPI